MRQRSRGKDERLISLAWEKEISEQPSQVSLSQQARLSLEALSTGIPVDT